MNFKLIALASCLLLMAQSSFAQNAGKVKAAQFPGWIERNGQVMAIKPGLSIEEGDIVRTGKGGKLLLRMNDGSDIKLGNDSQIDIKLVEKAKPENQNVFGLALTVLKGVFRFTTSQLGKNRKRNVAISFGTVTAGIRGTDIWGRVNAKTDLVCLLEGQIDVSHPKTETVRMDEPLQYYDALKNKAGALKGKVDETQITKWALLTELESNAGVMQENGQWSVVLMSLNNIEHAKKFSKQLNDKGYPAEIQSKQIGVSTYHRVIIPYFNNKESARNAMSRLDNVGGVNNAWVKKYSF